MWKNLKKSGIFSFLHHLRKPVLLCVLLFVLRVLLKYEFSVLYSFSQKISFHGNKIKKRNKYFIFSLGFAWATTIYIVGSIARGLGKFNLKWNGSRAWNEACGFSSPSRLLNSVLTLPVSGRRPSLRIVSRHLTFFFLFAVLGLAAAFLFMISNSTWCCIREYKRAQLCQVAVTVKEVLDEHEMEYFLNWGSLIGALRAARGFGLQLGVDKERGMIVWEHDIDIFIAQRHVSVAVDLLKEKGLEVYTYTGSRLGFRVHIPLYWSSYSAWIGKWIRSWAMTWIDVYNYEVVGSIVGGVDRRSLFSPNRNQRLYLQNIFYRDIFPTVNISYCGVSFPSPRRPDGFMPRYYGDDYIDAIKYPNGSDCNVFQDC